MTIQPSHMYRNPLDILISAEQGTCKGCKHVNEWMAFGNKIQQCDKGRKKRNSKCYEETFGINYTGVSNGIC